MGSWPGKISKIFQEWKKTTTLGFFLDLLNPKNNIQILKNIESQKKIPKTSFAATPCWPLKFEAGAVCFHVPAPWQVSSMTQETNHPSFLFQDGILLCINRSVLDDWISQGSLCSVEFLCLFEASVDSWTPMGTLKNKKHTKKSTDSTNSTTRMNWLWLKMTFGKGANQCEPRKKNWPYFPLYWLFNRDPYNGLL